MLQTPLLSPSPTPLAHHEASTGAGQREHIAYIEYFRAFAMIMIVTGHTYALAWTHGVNEDPTLVASLRNVVPAIVNGGTALFVFISGFLYRHLFFERVPYGEFMRRKSLYVGLPYLVIATPLVFALIALGAIQVTVVKEGVPYPESYFVEYITLITTGRMVTAYWYIPCVMLIFLASPLFDRFIRLASPARWWVLAASIGLALWIHRPHDNLDPVHSFVYFANFYMFGILFCEYRQHWMPYLKSNTVLVASWLAVLAIAAVQAAVVGRIDNIERLPGDGWLPVGLDLILLQKYAAIAALTGLLARYGDVARAPLKFISRYSFGIFFMHGVVLAVLMRFPDRWTPHVGLPLVDLLLYTSVVLGISVALVLAVKKVTGRYSRYIIGS